MWGWQAIKIALLKFFVTFAQTAMKSHLILAAKGGKMINQLSPGAAKVCQ